MQLGPNDAHIWSTNLTILPAAEKEKLALLSEDEKVRALRFRFPLHRMCFIAARGALREILSFYLKVAPHEITFAYTAHQKPYLAAPYAYRLAFNLAHSHDMAIYAITLKGEAGIDLEKIEPDYKPAIVKRYFSIQENNAFTALSKTEKITAFYRLWSRKEALIKAVGKGLSLPLASFSVSVKDEPEMIRLENELWSLFPLSINPQYEAAFATNQIINAISYWHLFDHEIKLNKVSKW